MAITFTVAGDPVPQPRARITVRAGHGHAYTPKDHKIHAYRAAVALKAKGLCVTPTDKPVTLEVVFCFKRPASHYGKGGVLKPLAPEFPKADCSNLLKGFEDSLNGIAWLDDSQVVCVSCSKLYGDMGYTLARIT